VAKVPKGYFTILEFMMMNEFERRVAADEFMRMFKDPAESLDSIAGNLAARPVQKAKKRVRKASKYGKALSAELKRINKTARTKSGRLRKGMTQQKILKRAHKAVKRRLK
tara:strand:+ start:1160 stop:1489 length:330 start_codon:yes stop_codon:yes gene_type:complete